MKKRIVNIQALRGAATLLVVLYHLMETEHKFAQGDSISPSFMRICATSVDMFFIISGFVLVTVSTGKFQKIGETLHFFYNRITRVYSLYWFYTVLLLVYFLLPPEMFSRPRQDINLFKSFLLLPQDNMPLLVVAWTLVYELYYYFIFGLLLFFAEKHLIKLLLLWAMAVVIGRIFLHDIVNPNTCATMNVITHPLTLEFIIGCIMAKMVFAGTRTMGLVLFIIGILMLPINHILSADMAMEGWDRLFFYGLPSTLIVYGAIAAELESNFMFPKFMQTLGDASYSMYLSHYIVLPIIGRLWPLVLSRFNISGEGQIDNIIASVIMLVVSIAAGIISFRLIENPMLSFFRKFDIRRAFK